MNVHVGKRCWVRTVGSSVTFFACICSCICICICICICRTAGRRNCWHASIWWNHFLVIGIGIVIVTVAVAFVHGCHRRRPCRRYPWSFLPLNLHCKSLQCLLILLFLLYWTSTVLCSAVLYYAEQLYRILFWIELIRVYRIAYRVQRATYELKSNSSTSMVLRIDYGLRSTRLVCVLNIELLLSYVFNARTLASTSTNGSRDQWRRLRLRFSSAIHPKVQLYALRFVLAGSFRSCLASSV